MAPIVSHEESDINVIPTFGWSTESECLPKRHSYWKTLVGFAVLALAGIAAGTVKINELGSRINDPFIVRVALQDSIISGAVLYGVTTAVL